MLSNHRPGDIAPDGETSLRWFQRSRRHRCKIAIGPSPLSLSLSLSLTHTPFSRVPVSSGLRVSLENRSNRENERIIRWQVNFPASSSSQWREEKRGGERTDRGRLRARNRCETTIANLILACIDLSSLQFQASSINCHRRRKQVSIPSSRLRFRACSARKKIQSILLR